MKSLRERMPVCGLRVMLIVVGGTTAARADSLRIQSPTSTYDLYEPIVVAVELRVDEPYQPDSSDPRTAAQVRRRLTHRRLDAELRDVDSHVLCDRSFALICGFQPRQEGQKVFRASGVVVLGNLLPESKPDEDPVFEFWTRPGTYNFVVVDRDNGLASNAVRIAIRPLDKRLLAAGEAFRSLGLAVMFALVGDELAERARPLLQQIKEEHTDTVFGAYAQTSLAMMNARMLREKRRVPENSTRAQVVQELQDAIARFPAGHPMRNNCLLYLAYIQTRQETIDRLLAETTDDYMMYEANLLRNMLTNVQSEGVHHPQESDGSGPKP